MPGEGTHCGDLGAEFVGGVSAHKLPLQGGTPPIGSGHVPTETTPMSSVGVRNFNHIINSWIPGLSSPTMNNAQ